jgi:hypothetical protein
MNALLQKSNVMTLKYNTQSRAQQFVKIICRGMFHVVTAWIVTFFIDLTIISMTE